MKFWNRSKKQTVVPKKGYGVSDGAKPTDFPVDPDWTPGPVADFIPEHWTKPPEVENRSPFYPDHFSSVIPVEKRPCDIDRDDE